MHSFFGGDCFVEAIRARKAQAQVPFSFRLVAFVSIENLITLTVEGSHNYGLYFGEFRCARILLEHLDGDTCSDVFMLSTSISKPYHAVSGKICKTRACCFSSRRVTSRHEER